MYVDAIQDRDADLVKVVERSPEGKRVFKEYPIKYYFYYKDPRGKYQSIYREPLTKVACRNRKEFQKELAIHNNKQLYESDLNPVFKVLEDYYLDAPAPKLNVAFFDLEVDFSEERGFAPPDDPFMPITAISIHLQWLDTLIGLALPPKTMSMEEAQKAVEGLPNVYLFENEKDMIETFLTLIDDADVLSGWNSTGFDIPYTVNRIKRIMGKEHTKRLCLWDKYPKKREYERHGKTHTTYDLVGRVHLDSLDVYQKYTFEERHSYRLDAIGELEVGEKKVQYEGSLDQLYNYDFRKFIEYNLQDTALLDKLDKKLKFLRLANGVAHANSVLLQTTLGSVAVTEQAIIKECHRLGLVAPNRKPRSENTQAAGAYVAYPKKGLHSWIGSVDINSLYPSTIRALNMSPETIIGQLDQSDTTKFLETSMAGGKSFAASWEGVFGTLEYQYVMDQDPTKFVTIHWENGKSDRVNAKIAYRLIFESGQPWMLSANGTIFSYEHEGIIPGLLARWYAERKVLQKKAKEEDEAGNVELSEDYDFEQLIKKLALNSLYGSLLNPGCRFFDQRLGQSTTLTGRQITKHMAGTINEIITGEFDHTGKSVIYGDTDSVDKDSIIKTSIGEMTIEKLFHSGTEFWNNGEKEYSYNPNIKIAHYSTEGKLDSVKYNYVYRHKVSKRRYKVTTTNGKEVIITEDHSIMIMNADGTLIEKKPSEINNGDIVVTIVP